MVKVLELNFLGQSNTPTYTTIESHHLSNVESLGIFFSGQHYGASYPYSIEIFQCNNDFLLYENVLPITLPYPISKKIISMPVWFLARTDTNEQCDFGNENLLNQIFETWIIKHEHLIDTQSCIDADRQSVSTIIPPTVINEVNEEQKLGEDTNISSDDASVYSMDSENEEEIESQGSEIEELDEVNAE